MEDDILMLCPHCGNKTLHGVLASAACEWIKGRNNTWLIARCRTCGMPTVVRATPTPEDPFDDTDHTLLYPDDGNPRVSSLPKKVEKEYTSARAIRRHDPNAFAVMVGRTLEAMCQDKGLQSQNLASSLAELSDQGLLPGTLADVSSHLRVVRNLGAHATGNVNRTDVPVLMEFLELLLRYVYEVPAKLEALAEDDATNSPDKAST